MTPDEAITPPAKREPFATGEEADAAVTRFLELVSEARRECRLAAVNLVLVTELVDMHDPLDTGTPEPTGETTMMVRAVHVGENAEGAAELATFAYQQFALPVVQRAQRLAGAAAGQVASPFGGGSAPAPATVTKASKAKREGMN
jgi:hypothetical protein